MSLKHVTLLVWMMALWGFNFVPIRIALDHMPPITFVAARFVITVLPAVFFVKRPPLPIQKLAIYGFLTFAGQFAFLAYAIHDGLSAGLASLVLQTQAFFTIAFAALYLRERPLLFQVVGAAVAMTGTLIVAFHIGGEVTAKGLFLIALAAACWGAGNVVTKSFGKVDMFAVVIWGSFFASIPLVILALVTEGPKLIIDSLIHIQWPTVLALAYNAYISTFVGYTLWSWMLARHPAALVAPFTLLIPAFAMLSAYIFLHEAFPVWKLDATLLIIAGVCLNQFGRKASMYLRWAFTSVRER